jgi:uncharacterized alpha-E superfamily protein
MLSRVAERVYWMSRYLERVENSARLVAVYGELLLDLPEEAKLDWSFALQILGMEAAYRDSGGSASELEFLLIAWRAINELHIYAANNLPNMARRPGSRIPAELVGQCHEITGILEGTMSHGPAYQFVRLGRSLERIDMTSRIIDVAAAIMLAGRDELQLHESTIWRAVLRAQGAYQMYRQYVRRRILGHDVVAFLLQDESFPRSVTHCMGVLENALGKLPRSDKAQVQMDAVRAQLAEVSVEDLDHAHLHQFADDLQLELAKLNDVIFDTWLNPLSAA